MDEACAVLFVILSWHSVCWACMRTDHPVVLPTRWTDHPVVLSPRGRRPPRWESSRFRDSDPPFLRKNSVGERNQIWDSTLFWGKLFFLCFPILITSTQRILFFVSLCWPFFACMQHWWIFYQLLLLKCEGSAIEIPERAFAAASGRCGTVAIVKMSFSISKDEWRNVKSDW